MRICVYLPDDRSRTGQLIAEWWGPDFYCDVAMTMTAIDVGEGDYNLVRRVITDDGQDSQILRAYGPGLMLFQNQSQHQVAIHGGDSGADGLLVAVDGTLRVSNEDMTELLELAGDKDDIPLSFRLDEWSDGQPVSVHTIQSRQTEQARPIDISDDISDADLLGWFMAYHTLTDWPAESPSPEAKQVFPGFGGGQTGAGGGGAGWVDKPTASTVVPEDLAANPSDWPVDQPATERPDDRPLRAEADDPNFPERAIEPALKPEDETGDDEKTDTEEGVEPESEDGDSDEDEPDDDGDEADESEDDSDDDSGDSDEPEDAADEPDGGSDDNSPDTDVGSGE